MLDYNAFSWVYKQASKLNYNISKMPLQAREIWHYGYWLATLSNNWVSTSRHHNTTRTHTHYSWCQTNSQASWNCMQTDTHSECLWNHGLHLVTISASHCRMHIKSSGCIQRKTNLCQFVAQNVLPSFLRWPFWNQNPVSLRCQSSNKCKISNKRRKPMALTFQSTAHTSTKTHTCRTNMFYFVTSFSYD